MIIEPIIKHLHSCLPVKSPYFSSRIQVVSVDKIGLIATVTTATDHGLSVGNFVTVGDVLSPIEIESAVETATEIDFKCVTPHDLTLSPTAPKDQNQMVRITGSSFDEKYLLTKVTNRFRFTVKKDSQPALPVSDTLFLQEQSAIGYNGLKQVIDVPSSTSFTYELDFDYPAPNFTEDSYIATGVRISGGIDIDTVTESYTKQQEEELWLFVTPQDAEPNKDRRTPVDAQSTQSVQGDFRQRIIDGFEVYIFVPNKGSALTNTNGRFAWDLVQQIKPDLFQCLLGLTFDSGLACQGQEIITYNGDGFFSYNGSYYIHRFSFQNVIDITKDDTANEVFTRAFRDIMVEHKNQFSEITTYNSEINLDDEPESV